MNTCMIIPIVVGLISALLGYLIGKMSSGNSQSEIDALLAKNRSLEADLKACKSKLGELEMSNSRMASAAVSAASSNAFNASEAKAIFGKTIKENDLTIVEGIGPKIQELFHKHGIHTWKALSESTVEHCQKILDDGGEAYAIHNPGTWPEQAKLAYEGRWKELLDWQDELDGGK